jgi:enamine deaminase RidA (YjgF/YER057c/UK114 family)
MAITYVGAGARMSDAAVHNGTAYLRGFVPSNSFGKSIEEQSVDVLAQVAAALAGVGSAKDHLLQVQIWLRDIGMLAAFNAVYDGWIVTGAAPPRMCVQAELFRADCLVEVSAIAVVTP